MVSFKAVYIKEEHRANFERTRENMRIITQFHPSHTYILCNVIYRVVLESFITLNALSFIC